MYHFSRNHGTGCRIYVGKGINRFFDRVRFMTILSHYLSICYRYRCLEGAWNVKNEEENPGKRQIFNLANTD